MQLGGITLRTGDFIADGATSDSSLDRNLIKKPQVAPVIYNMFPNMSLTAMTSPFIDKPEEALGDRKFIWGVMGRRERNLTCTGATIQGTGAGDNSVIIEFKENYGLPNSTWQVGTNQFRIQRKATQSANGYEYVCKLVKRVSSKTFDSSQFTKGRKAGPVGDIYAPYSEKGYGSQKYPDMLENFTTITRSEFKMDGSAPASISWFGAGGVEMWAPGSAEQWVRDFGDKDGGFMYKLERMSWSQESTMGDDGNPTITDDEGNPIYAGLGFEQQIIPSMSMDYAVSQFNEDYVFDVIQQFKRNGGITKGKIFVHTGNGGAGLWARTFSKYLKESRGIQYQIEGGRKVTIGFNEYIYVALGCEIQVMENPLLTDWISYPDLAPGTINTAKGYNFYLVDNTMEDGIPTVQKLVRNANGYNRSLLIKSIPGMLNPYDPQSMYASNARDGAAYEMLSEYMIAVRKRNRVAKLICTSF